MINLKKIYLKFKKKFITSKKNLFYLKNIIFQNSSQNPQSFLLKFSQAQIFFTKINSIKKYEIKKIA